MSNAKPWFVIVQRMADGLPSLIFRSDQFETEAEAINVAEWLKGSGGSRGCEIFICRDLRVVEVANDAA